MDQTLPPPEGTLFLSRSREGQLREEGLRFASLQELIDLCTSAAEQGGSGFARVLVEGESGGRRQRLVLDFGHFGAQG